MKKKLFHFHRKMVFLLLVVWRAFNTISSFALAESTMLLILSRLLTKQTKIPVAILHHKRRWRLLRIFTHNFSFILSFSCPRKDEVELLAVTAARRDYLFTDIPSVSSSSSQLAQKATDTRLYRLTAWKFIQFIKWREKFSFHNIFSSRFSCVWRWQKGTSLNWFSFHRGFSFYWMDKHIQISFHLQIPSTTIKNCVILWRRQKEA